MYLSSDSGWNWIIRHLERLGAVSTPLAVSVSMCFHTLLQELILREILWASLQNGHLMGLLTAWRLRAGTSVPVDRAEDAYLL